MHCGRLRNMSHAPEPTLPSVQMDVDGQTLEAPTGQTLLLTLLRAGIPWPASCRNGTCRSCIGRLARGEVVYDIAWPGLLPEEKADGCVLPCVARPLSDLKLQALDR